MSRKSILMTVGILCVAAVLLIPVGSHMMAADAPARPLAHNVYFSLKDPTPANIEALNAACHKYLNGHDGLVYFGAGPLVEELARPVNQRDFHIALVTVFKDKAAHDQYQTHPRHLQFIAENKETWASVRVFDSWGK
jgi:hypothetical protein